MFLCTTSVGHVIPSERREKEIKRTRALAITEKAVCIDDNRRESARIYGYASCGEWERVRVRGREHEKPVTSVAGQKWAGEEEQGSERHAWLLVCLPVCLSVCLSACLSGWLAGCWSWKIAEYGRARKWMSVPKTGIDKIIARNSISTKEICRNW